MKQDKRQIPDDYIERCYAGWLGKVIGVRHGAPIEGWTYEQINNAIGEIDGYLVDYKDFAADDDTQGPMFFLRALDDFTNDSDLTPEQIGLTWLNYLPYEHGFFWWGGYGVSTEHTAYLNLRNGIMAPRSGSVEQNGKTVAEQIGGQIFIDIWGLLNPNNPKLASEYAKKAASVSHGGNGIYGGMFIAAAISAAFEAKDIKTILDQALNVIPEECTYAKMVNDIKMFHQLNDKQDWRKCYKYIYEKWGYKRYPGNCHIIPNSAVIIMSLLYSDNSFDKAINICNMAGWDTDCNVGNVGCIMGTFLGLEAINYEKWRKPINDFLVSASVVGCLNIMELPGCVRRISRLAYKIAGESWGEEWDDFLNDNAAQFNFALPGSTHAFRMEGAKEMVLTHNSSEMNSGRGCLKALYKGVSAGAELKLFYKTYYRPVHFHDSRFDPAFSPILYPGQTISAYVMTKNAAKLKTQVFVFDSNSNKLFSGVPTSLNENEWTKISFTIPRLEGACIDQAGVLFTTLNSDSTEAIIYLDEMRIEGNPSYSLVFLEERIEDWTTLHKEVSQMTRLKGIWDLEDGCLRGSCSDFGEAYTGNVEWRNYEAAYTFAPMNTGLSGFIFRAQGAIRSYSVCYENDQLLLQKNNNGYQTLCSMPYFWPAGESRCLTTRVIENEIEIWENNNLLMQYIDNNKPYLNGLIGLRVENGGTIRCQKISVEGI